MRIVLVGAGHTHVEVLRMGSLFTSQGHELVLISPSPEHPYSGMAPGVLGGVYSQDAIMLPAADIAGRRGASSIRERAVGLDPGKKILYLESGTEIPYDLLSLNLGSETSFPAAVSPASALNRFTSKPVVSLLELKKLLDRNKDRSGSFRIAVVGGGPAGVEIAANLAFAYRRNSAVKLIAAESAALGGYAGKGARYIARILARWNVALHRSPRLESEEDVHRLEADIVVFATGVSPPKVLRQFNLPLHQDGGVKVNEYLQADGFADIYAVGDCASFYLAAQKCYLPRIGVYAVRQQRILLNNLLATAGERSSGQHKPDAPVLRPFAASGAALSALNLGGGYGILRKGRLLLKGRAAFLFKDYLDRRFMARYRNG